MISKTYLHASCPACLSPAHAAKQLFQVELLGEISSVNKCYLCGLIYKSRSPTSQGFQIIYSNEYEHFKKNIEEGSLAELYSAKQKLNRCLKLLNRVGNSASLKIIDYGCGSGRFVDLLRSLNLNAIGVDPYLPKKLENEYLHNSTDINLQENSFDIVFALNVAEHLENPQLVFKQFGQLLKPNGVVLLTCPYGNSLACHFYHEQWQHLALEEHLLFWTPRSLTQLFRSIGFTGKVSYRTSGTPFPYGRVKLLNTPPSNAHQATEDASLLNPVSRYDWQRKAWQLGKWMQRRETISNLARQLIHFTHSGDYLEYAISRNYSHS